MSEAIDYRRHDDPEYRRWGRKYPRFPGVAECVRLLSERNVRGSWVEIIAHELEIHAGGCLPELVAVFRSEESERARLIVLAAIVDAELPAAIPFLAEVVRERRAPFATYAEQGLSAIGTSEARTALRAATQGAGGSTAPTQPTRPQGRA